MKNWNCERMSCTGTLFENLDEINRAVAFGVQCLDSFPL